MRLTSSAFDEGAAIPARYTCDGLDVSPPLTIIDMPPGTVALVLVMDDPDAPSGTWDHWVVCDIPPVAQIPEDARSLGTPGRNSWGRDGYGGPCPPSGTHRYVFTIRALGAELGLGEGATKADVLAACAGRVLAEARLLGTCTRATTGS